MSDDRREQESPSKKRLVSLDFAKGVAIILVVWGHADIRMDPMFYEQYLETINTIIFSFHMPLFFMISAALMQRTIDDDDLKGLDYLKKISSNILIPYFSLNFLFGVIKLLTPRSLYNVPSAREMITAVLIKPSSVDSLPSGPLWFLFTLYSAALITYFLVKKLKIGKYNLLIISVLLALSYPVFHDVDLLGLRRFVYNFEFFVFGYILSDPIMHSRLKRFNAPLLFLVWVLPFLVEGVYGPFKHLTTGVAGAFSLSLSVRR